MNTNILVIIAVVVLLAVGGFLLFSGDGVDTGTVDEETTDESAENTSGDTAGDEEVSDTTADEGNAPTEPQTVTVTYTSDGFSPKTVTINAGDTVRFVNESSGGMWMASNNHPTHTILPSFDHKKSVGNGETYEFTFTETGSWGYHNHVNAGKGGTVIVE
jgi:plastocyanin|tara:strand:- start:27983 stop:28462 length:480 start_codon:yes stop_codon:yes gene_type:complete